MPLPRTVKKTITVSHEQDLWLKAHPEINFSGQVQAWLAELMARERAK
jgi:capsule polysaccharide export protein KpsC/LpsZ